MNGPNQFLDSIFEPRSFPLLRANTFCSISNLFVHLSAVQGTIHDTLANFDIAISNSLAKSVLKATKSSLGGSTAKLGRIPTSISKGDFRSVPGQLRYPPSISRRQMSQLRSFLLNTTFYIARFYVPTILSTSAFPLGLYAEIIFQSIDAPAV